MTLKEIMSKAPVSIGRGESVAVAARLLTQYNVGALPVRDQNGNICGIVTDRDIVTRCIAAGKVPEQMQVSRIMTQRVITATAEMKAEEAASLMGSEQIRRLPVMEDGKLCGMVSVADLVNGEDRSMDTIRSLCEISANVRRTRSCGNF